MSLMIGASSNTSASIANGAAAGGRQALSGFVGALLPRDYDVPVTSPNTT
ncbi:hypothetical protein ACVW1C_005991 [Bradyrhizobium sp. USDA 4011]